MPGNMKCGRLRASNCFEVFFLPQSPSPATAASAPSFSLLLLASFPPFLLSTGFRSARINKCALSPVFPFSFLRFFLYVPRRGRQRERVSCAFVFLHRLGPHPAPPFIAVSSMFFRHGVCFRACRWIDPKGSISVADGYIALRFCEFQMG